MHLNSNASMIDTLNIAWLSFDETLLEFQLTRKEIALVLVKYQTEWNFDSYIKAIIMLMQ